MRFPVESAAEEEQQWGIIRKKIDTKCRFKKHQAKSNYVGPSTAACSFASEYLRPASTKNHVVFIMIWLIMSYKQQRCAPDVRLKTSQYRARLHESVFAGSLSIDFIVVHTNM